MRLKFISGAGLGWTSSDLKRLKVLESEVLYGIQIIMVIKVIVVVNIMKIVEKDFIEHD